jgi:hypothetical protein
MVQKSDGQVRPYQSFPAEPIATAWSYRYANKGANQISERNGLKTKQAE